MPRKQKKRTKNAAASRVQSSTAARAAAAKDLASAFKAQISEIRSQRARQAQTEGLPASESGPLLNERFVAALERARPVSRLLATGSVSSIKEWLTGKEPDVAGFPHAKNFAWVEFEGERIYMKSPRQIDVVRMLAEAGPPFELFHKTILEKLKTPDSALRDTFRNSKLWNRLIISDPRRRTVRLALPPAPE